MSITPFYASLLALLFVSLSVRALLLRRHLRIPVGDQGNSRMLRAMRVHANFAEYVPLTLLLILMLELTGGLGIAVHALCVALLLGRLVHAYGVDKDPEDFRFRVFGMAMTLGALVTASLYLLGLCVTRWSA